jgi:hypothetical protein
MVVKMCLWSRKSRKEDELKRYSSLIPSPDINKRTGLSRIRIFDKPIACDLRVLDSRFLAVNL